MSSVTCMRAYVAKLSPFLFPATLLYTSWPHTARTQLCFGLLRCRMCRIDYTGAWGKPDWLAETPSVNQHLPGYRYMTRE